MTQMTDGIGTTLIGYNAASEQTSIDGPWANDTITLGRDAVGRVTSRSIGGVAETTGFDTLGRISGVTNPLGSFSYGYAGPGSAQLTSIGLPNGQTTALSYYGAAGDQRLQQIWNKTPGAQTLSKFDYQYNVQGQITQWGQQLGSAPAKAYEFGYDAVGQLVSAVLKNTGTGAVLASHGYRYDGAGNRTQEIVGSRAMKEAPNTLNQLVSREGGAGVIPIRGQTSEPASVTVNGVAARGTGGNEFEGTASVSAGNNVVTVQAADPSGNVANQQYQVVVTGSGTKTLTYDFNGNLTGDGEKTYEWDAADRLMAINYTGTAKRSEFTYDGLSRRVKIVEKDGAAVASEKRLLWDGTEIAEERSASNAVTKRYFAQGFQSLNTQPSPLNYFYTRDHLGSIREVTDASATVRARYDYSPYGERTKLEGDVEADFAFTGHYYHAPSTLHLALYRAYDAEVGRWLNRDPIEEDGGLNLYRYVDNTPVNAADPTGLAPILCEPPKPDIVDNLLSDPEVRTAATNAWNKGRWDMNPRDWHHEYYFFVTLDPKNHGTVKITAIKRSRGPGGGYVGVDLKQDPPNTVCGVHIHPSDTPASLKDFGTGAISGDYKTVIKRKRPEIIVRKKFMYRMDPDGKIRKYPR